MATVDILLCAIRPDGIRSVPEEAVEILKEIRIRRIERAFGYLFISLAGVFLTFEPSKIIGENVSTVIELSWSISMIISGLICLYGSVTDKWIGEYAGAPLLLSVMFLYAAACVRSAWGESLPLFAFGLIVAAYGWSLWGRWKDVRAIKRQAVALGCSEEE